MVGQRGRLAVGEGVVACGRKGMGPAEIAARLGWSRAELRAVAARWPALGRELERARDAALAWWEARARLWAGERRPNAGLWGRAMAGRFAAEGYGPPGRGAARSEEKARPRREVSARDRAKAVRLLLAEAGSDGGPGRSART